MKLYVGNLPWSIDEKALKELFKSYGDIEEAVLIKDKFSGRSKGFGFVTLSDDAAAKKAIAEMHEKEIEGRPLTVSEAKPMVPRDNAPRYNARDSGESAEAPMADPSTISQDVEDSMDEDAPETADEAVEDAESDEPAVDDAVEAEETTEDEE